MTPANSVRQLCLRLAAARRKRMAEGRPVFDLTDAELRSSADTAMRLAGAARRGTKAKEPNG